MGLISLLFTEPLAFFLVVIPLIYSIIAHEVAHGFVASLFGDDTARRAGRLTLNPIKHIDPVGTLMLLVVGFGWAKPVPVDYRNFRYFRAGLICVSLAGCVVNIIIATFAYAILEFTEVPINSPLGLVLLTLAHINVILGALNLIPIPPLDGSKVVMGFLPRNAQIQFARLESYGMPILIILLITNMLHPIITFISGILRLFIGLLLALFR